MRNRSPIKARGGTIVELIAAIIIFSVVLTAPFLAGSTARSMATQTRNHEKIIVQILQRLYLEAIQRGRVIELRVAPHSLRAALGDQVLTAHHLPSALRLTLASNDSGLMHFYPSGVVSPSTVTLESTVVRCEIVASLRGRIRHQCWER